MAKTKIKDVYNGEQLTVWEDEEFITLSFYFTSISILKEDWEEVKKDLRELVKILED